MRPEKNIPNLLTLCNLLCGCFGVVACFNGDLPMAGLLVFAGAFFDLLDGMAARLLKVNSPIGKDLDSLADVVTFGMLPAFIIHLLLKKSHAEWMEIFYIADAPVVSLLPFLLTACSALRLAKFNNDTTQSSTFRGLPTPANGMFFASFPLILLNNNFVLHFDIYHLSDIFLNPFLLIGLVVIFSWLMLSNVRLLSFKLKGMSFAANKQVYILAIISVILFAALLWMAIPLIILLYIILSYIAKPKADEVHSSN
jgi:CDP-diacylglycerol--serine O-phosphatidyltransferase